MAKKPIEKICKNCRYWNPKQAELEYSTFYGICTCYKWEFTTTNDADVVVLDRESRSDKHMGVRRFESQKSEIPFGAVNWSNYCLATEKNFGCIHFNNRR